MLRERIGHSTSGQVVTTSIQATVLEVARLMVSRDAGAVMVVEGDALIGIFTERDAVFRVLSQALDPRRVTVGEVMTPRPVTIGPEATFGQAMLTMLDHGFRRLPVVEDGRVVGLVTARNALDPDLEDFICEERRREALREPEDDPGLGDPPARR